MSRRTLHLKTERFTLLLRGSSFFSRFESDRTRLWSGLLRSTVVRTAICKQLVQSPTKYDGRCCADEKGMLFP